MACWGFQLARNTSDKPFVELPKYPERLQRFGKAMSLFSKAPGMGPSRLIDVYPWSTLKDGHATVVDVGGSFGNSSIALAEHYPDLKFIVQDLPGVVAKAETPSTLEKRVTFVAHDLLL